jgi:hypothetical protein
MASLGFLPELHLHRHRRHYTILIITTITAISTTIRSIGGGRGGS